MIKRKIITAKKLGITLRAIGTAGLAGLCYGAITSPMGTPPGEIITKPFNDIASLVIDEPEAPLPTMTAVPPQPATDWNALRGGLASKAVYWTQILESENISLYISAADYATLKTALDELPDHILQVHRAEIDRQYKNALVYKPTTIGIEGTQVISGSSTWTISREKRNEIIEAFLSPYISHELQQWYRDSKRSRTEQNCSYNPDLPGAETLIGDFADAQCTNGKVSAITSNAWDDGIESVYSFTEQMAFFSTDNGMVSRLFTETDPARLAEVFAIRQRIEEHGQAARAARGERFKALYPDIIEKLTALPAPPAPY